MVICEAFYSECRLDIGFIKPSARHNVEEIVDNDGLKGKYGDYEGRKKLFPICRDVSSFDDCIEEPKEENQYHEEKRKNRC